MAVTKPGVLILCRDEATCSPLLYHAMEYDAVESAAENTRI